MRCSTASITMLLPNTCTYPDAKGKIIDVVQQGMKLGDKIIRFPKVVVAQ